MKTKFEVYEEDQYENTWRVGLFPSQEAADRFRRNMYGENSTYKVREVIDENRP